jgi:hypothetical protein
MYAMNKTDSKQKIRVFMEWRRDNNFTSYWPGGALLANEGGYSNFLDESDTSAM